MRIIIAISIVFAFLAACGKNEQANKTLSSTETAHTETESRAAEAESPLNAPEGYETIGGEWKVGGIVYKGALIDINDVEALEDLYDNTLLTFNEDGSFVYLKTFNNRGSWAEKQPGSDLRFILKTESVFRYTLENGLLTETEAESTNLKQYIVTMLDANTFVLYEYDDITGEAKANDTPCIFVKQGEQSDYIAYNKTSVNGSSEKKTETSDSKQKETTSRPSSSSSSSATSGEKNALAKALQYLDYTAFSYSGLIEQLEFEGYSHSEAVYGADHCGADWYEQAAEKAQQYLDYSAFSRAELIDQLLFEGFTQAEAEYGVNKVY